MDTKNDSSLSDVPTFKVARVGNDRKRKGGAFSFLRSGGARGSWSGATGGAGGVGGVGAGGMGAAAGAGFTFSKVMLICLVSVGGLGAVGLGRMIGNARQEVKKPKAFSMARDPIKLEGDTSNLPRTANTIPNSLGYLSGSMDGLTPEERAKKAADAEAQRLADEEAARKAEEEQTAANPAVDPNALLASAQADGAPAGKGSAFGKKFGSLSSSLGGGSALSGGAGLSGGVNRQFGSGGGMAIKKGAAGKMSAMKGAARPSYSKAGGARLASSKTKGFARKQLANANAYSRRGAAASTGETSSADAGTAFDNNPGAGNVISGPGVGQGGGPASGAGNTPNAVDNGGPTGGGDPTVDCGANNYQDEYGNCKKIKTSSGSDANKALTMMANVVMGLLLVIGVISAFAALTRDSVILAEIYPVLAAIVGALGVVVALLGVAMIAMGDYVTGGLATLIGGYVGYMSFISPETLTVGQGMVAGFGGAALAMVGKMMGGGKNKAPEAAQQ